MFMLGPHELFTDTLYVPFSASVVVLDLNGDGAAKVAADLNKSSAAASPPQAQKCMGIACNVAQRASVEAAFAHIYANYSRVDILINNAGVRRSDRSYTIQRRRTFVDARMPTCAHLCRLVDICIYTYI